MGGASAPAEPLAKTIPDRQLPANLMQGLYGSGGPMAMPPLANIGAVRLARQYCPTVADCIGTLKRDVYRKGIDVRFKFARRCDACDMDFEDEVEECEICGEETREPKYEEMSIAKSWMRQANYNKETLEQVCAYHTDDMETFDDAFFVAIKDYIVDPEGTIISRTTLELRRGFAGRIWLIFDEHYNRKGYTRDGPNLVGYFTCVIHRKDNLKNKQERCKCGRWMHPCVAVGLDVSNQPTIGFIEGEIHHQSKYSPSEGYGFPPIMTLWTPIMTLTAMDLEQYLTYANDRPVKGVLAFITNNPQSLFDQLKKQDEERIRNPNHIYKVAVQSESRAGGVQFEPITQSLNELQNIEQRQDLMKRIWSFFGVEPIFMADVSAGGGLNNEGRQETVENRSLEVTHNIYHSSVFPWVQEQFGLTDVEFFFPDPKEQDKAANVMLRSANLDLIAKIQMAGGTVEITDDENFDFRIIDMPDFAEMGMGFGGGGMGGGFGEQSGRGPRGGSFTINDAGQKIYGKDPGGEVGVAKSDYMLEFMAKAIRRDRSWFNDLVKALETMLEGVEMTPDSYRTPEAQKALLEDVVKTSMDAMEDATAQQIARTIYEGIVDAGANPLDMGLDVDVIEALAAKSLVWDTFTGMGEDLSVEMGVVIEKAHLKEGGISVSKMVKDLGKVIRGKRTDLQRIARTETNAFRNAGRELGYRHADPDGQWLYKWAGGIDTRTCKAHRTLIRETARNPLPLDAIRDRVTELTKMQMGPNWEPRGWVIHPNQRGILLRTQRRGGG